MTTQGVVCGRCGADNPQNTEICQSCGAFMAAYQAPAGATETVEALTQPTESAPRTEIVYIPQTPPPVIDDSPVAELTPELHIGDAATEPELVEAREDFVELLKAYETETEENITAVIDAHAEERVQGESRVELPVTFDPTSIAQRPRIESHPTPAEWLPVEQPPPAPEIFQKLFGVYADDVYYSASEANSRYIRGSPTSLILAGVAALIFVCLLTSAMSSNGWVILLIGGPLAFSLIAIGVLLLIGRYPTGRP